MLRRDITFENPFTEERVTETHYFHISKADLVEMELEEHDTSYTKDGQEYTGMQAKLQRIVDSNDGRAILKEFKDMIHRAYGIKEGERFRKTQQIADDFMSSEAASQLIFELCTNPDEAGNFINGIVPGNLDQIAEEVRAQAEKVAAGREAQEQAKAAGAQPEGANANGQGVLTREQEITQATPEKPVVLTTAEVQSMEDHQLKAGIADGRYKFA